MSEVDERSSGVSALEAPVAQKGDSRASWPLILTGLLIAGAIVIAALVISNDTSATTDPVDAAEQLITALDEHDAEAFRNLVSEDVTISGDWDLTLDNLETMLEFDRAVGFSYDLDACTEASPSLARCTYSVSNDLTTALGVGPYSGGLFQVRTENGEIAAVANIEENRDTIFEEAMQPFGAWLEERDPEAHQVMTGELSAEALALWEEYVDEFVATVGSG
jgi:hypothetical protein